MNKIFDIHELTKPIEKGDDTWIETPESKSRFKRIRFDEMHEKKVESIKMLCGRLPKENEIFFLETLNSFNAFTFIVYLIKHAGRIENLYMATYSINLRIVDSLLNKINKNQVGKILLYISDSIRYRQPKVYDRLQAMERTLENFSVQYAWTHKKVIAAKIGDAHYIVEGSGNFGENSREEQYIFTRSKQLYGFRTNST